MSKYKFTHCSLCGRYRRLLIFSVCVSRVCVLCQRAILSVTGRILCTHIVFSIYQSVFHCPSIMPSLPLSAVVVQCVFCVRAIRMFLSFHHCGRRSGWFSVKAKALCLKSYRERCARSNRSHKAFNLLSLSNCMGANIL